MLTNLGAIFKHLYDTFLKKMWRGQAKLHPLDLVVSGNTQTV